MVGEQTHLRHSTWKLRSSYDTAEKCEQMRQGLLAKGVAMTETAAPESNEYIIGQQLGEAECIATDDPRFKSKLSHPALQTKTLDRKIKTVPAGR